MIKTGFCMRCQKAADPADLITVKTKSGGGSQRHRDECFRAKKLAVGVFAAPVAGQLRRKLHPSSVGKLEEWVKHVNYA